MAKYELGRKFYVASDGSYGYGDVLTYEMLDDLSEEQIRLLESVEWVSDHEKVDFVQAVLDDNEYELPYFIDAYGLEVIDE